jgi:hypothetical protein
MGHHPVFFNILLNKQPGSYHDLKLGYTDKLIAFDKKLISDLCSIRECRFGVNENGQQDVL